MYMTGAAAAAPAGRGRRATVTYLMRAFLKSASLRAAAPSLAELFGPARNRLESSRGCG
jgi:hypothetical protein